VRYRRTATERVVYEGMERRGARTEYGDDIDGVMADAPDTERRGTSDSGSHGSGAGSGVDEGDEVCVVDRELDAPESLLESAEDATATAAGDCK